LWLEALEDRVMLDTGLPAAIVVGRTLSAYFTGDVRDHQETITYTVYNEQANPVSGVLLTDTLEPGVTVVNASQLPDQSSRDLAWSLGTIAGYDRASVTLTVALADPIPLQLDAGAHAYVMLDAGAVTNATPAATLRPGSVDPGQLASTPDANTTDPFIQEEAAKLNYDPQQIFDFLHAKIVYNSYFGSLRGARGTLWSRAGNSLDLASLGIALLRSSGIPAQYAGGSLSDELSRQLILSMFPQPQSILGYVDTGIQKSDPANDPQLITETRDHFWIEYNAGNGFRDADPEITKATLGQKFAATLATFTDVPDILRHKVELTLSVELTSSASQLFGLGRQQKTVLDQSFDTVDVVGKPLAVGNLVNLTTVGSALLSSETVTYSPYVRVINPDGAPDDDQLFRGTDYQEVFTNFPLSSIYLTGLFLNIKTIDPQADGTQDTSVIEKTLLDRTGIVSRQNGSSSTMSGPVGSGPALSENDLTTLDVTPSSESVANLAGLTRALGQDAAAIDLGLSSQSSNDPTTSSEALRRTTLATRDAITRMTALLVGTFVLRSDQVFSEAAGGLLVRGYVDSARAIAASSFLVRGSASLQDQLQFGFDILRNPSRALAYPNQVSYAGIAARTVQGVGDSVLEAMVLQQALGEADVHLSAGVTAFDLAVNTSIPLLLINQNNIRAIQDLPLSAEAKTRISIAVASGQTVITPTTMVTVDGRQTIDWFELDPTTGRMISVSEDGTHGILADVVAVYRMVRDKIAAAAAASVGYVYVVSSILAIQISNYFYEGLEVGESTLADLTAERLQIEILLDRSLSLIESPTVRYIAMKGAYEGATMAFDAWSAYLRIDPPIGTFLVSPRVEEQFMDIGSEEGGNPITSIIPDSLFTVPVSGAQVHSSFMMGIHNPASKDRSFSISVVPPSGFSVLTSAQSIDVGSDQTGEIGLYLQPSGDLPPPGTSISFTVTATSASDPTITATQTVTFTMPVVHAVTLVSNNPTLNVVPGSGWGFSVTLQNAGNVAETVQPTAAIPAGLNLPGGFFNFHDVMLAPGQSVVETDTRTADASLSLNSMQTVTVTATYGPAEAPLTQTVQVPVQIILPGAFYAGNLSIAAAQAGMTDLSNRLGDLSTALTNLFMEPTDAVTKSQALADLDSVIAQLADDPFLSFAVPNLSGGRDLLATANTANQVQYAANVLGGDLNFAWILPDEAEHRFTLALSPNSAVAQPQTPVYYNVALRNTGTETTTYDFSIFNQPAGLKFTFNQPSITLAPGQAINGGPDGVTLAVTETGNNLIAAGFNVNVVAEGTGDAISLSAPGTVTLRPAFVSVPEVDATPSFTEPGSPVDVSAKVLNAVNQQEQARASFTVADANGNVVFTSASMPLTLTVQTSLAAVDLGSFGTSGLTPGNYSICVSVTDGSGNPIPGAVGHGTVFVGSPVTASLSVSPTTSLPGSPTVTNTVQVTAQTPFPTPLTLLGQVQTTPSGTTIALDGNLAYVAGTNGIDVVDITDPTNPKVLNTFAGDLIVKDGLTVVRRVGNDLVVGSTVETHSGSSQFGFKLLVYSLGDPLHPTLISQTPIDYAFLGDLLVNGTTVLVPTSGADYFAGFLSFQFGSLLSLDLSDPAKPVLREALYNNRGAPFGGDTNQDGGTLVNDHIAYIASSTSTSSFLSQPAAVGRVLVVDYSDPANLSVLGEVDIPGTVHALDVAVQGDRALVLGSTGDWKTSVDDITQAGLTGNLTLTVLDISDPLAPKVVGTTLVTDGGFAPASAADKISVLPLGNGLFAVSEAEINGKSQVLLVDPNDPNNLVVTALATPAPVTEMAVSGGLLYMASSAGLGIYQINSVVGEPATVSVRVPNTTGVAIVPNSFNIPPTRIIHGTEYDTLVWDRTLAFGESQPTFTWQSKVNSLLPGESRDVTLGGTIDFVSQGTAGSIALPPTAVSGVHFISLDPASQTVRPGDTVTFHITLHNPSPFNEGFGLSVKGLPESWVHMTSAVEIVGNGFADVTLQITPNATADLGDFGFQVMASYGFVDPTFANSGSDTVLGTLTVTGKPVARPYIQAHGVVASLAPSGASAGQGTSATYTVQVINTGSAVDTFALAVQGLPAGVTGSFAQTTVEVPPGVSNFRDLTLTLTPAAGSPPGDIPFQVVATSVSEPTASGATSGTLTVLPGGVSVSLDPRSGAPGDRFRLTVTNTGSAADTFDLALAGPAALVAQLSLSQVTLAPGASQAIPIITGVTDFAVPGQLMLTATATSETSSAVRAEASAAIHVPAFTGLSVQLQPESARLLTPGSAPFLLLVQNLGNTEEAYTATIVGINGPLSASLVGLDGLPTQTIPLFRLPGLSSGAIVLQADLTSFGIGTVTVRIKALDGSETAEVTATVNSSQPVVPPTPLPTPPLPVPASPPVTALPPTLPAPPPTPLASLSPSGVEAVLQAIKRAATTSPSPVQDSGSFASLFPETQSAKASSSDFGAAKFSDVVAINTVFGAALPGEGPRADYLGEEDIVPDEGAIWWQPAELMEAMAIPPVSLPDRVEVSVNRPGPNRFVMVGSEPQAEQIRLVEKVGNVDGDWTRQRDDSDTRPGGSGAGDRARPLDQALGAVLATVLLVYVSPSIARTRSHEVDSLRPKQRLGHEIR
jgi:uncharacterized membrane protein